MRKVRRQCRVIMYGVMHLKNVEVIVRNVEVEVKIPNIFLQGYGSRAGCDNRLIRLGCMSVVENVGIMFRFSWC